MSRTTRHAWGRVGDLAGLCLAVMLAAACQQEQVVEPGGSLRSPLSYFTVELVNASHDADNLPAYNEETTVTLAVTAMGDDGQKAEAYSGQVRVKTTTGTIRTKPQGMVLNADKHSGVMTMTGGSLPELTLGIKWGLGQGRIVVEETITGVADHYRDGVGAAPSTVRGVAVGASPVLTFAPANIINMQRIMAETYDLEVDETALNGQPVIISTGKLVVTGCTADGFFATDVSQPDLAWSHVYVYTWSSPFADVGSVLRYFSGMVSDFYGFTEISSFPDWDVVALKEAWVPEPHLLTATDFASAATLVEPWEAALVKVENVCVSAMTQDQLESYQTYGQWPAGFACGKSDFVVVSSDAAPAFDPRTMSGQAINFMIGNLKQHFSAGYILVLRTENDLGLLNAR